MLSILTQPLGIDFFCLRRKFLLGNLIDKNLKLRYRGSFLGILWTLVIPVCMTFVYYILLQFVMRVQIENPILFLMTGVLPWSFFASSIVTGMESIVVNQALINKVPIPALAFPLADVLTSLINLLLGLPVLLGLMLILGVAPSWALLMVPVYLGMLALQAYSLALILSIGFVFLRDLRQIMGIVIQIWFYATPVLYSAEMVPESFRFLLALNPVAYLIQGMTSAFTLGQLVSFEMLTVSIVWTVALFGLAIVVYKTKAQSLAEAV